MAQQADSILRGWLRRTSRALNRLPPSWRTRVSRAFFAVSRVLGRAARSAEGLTVRGYRIPTLCNALSRLQVKFAERAELLAAYRRERSVLSPLKVIEEAGERDKVLAAVASKLAKGANQEACSLIQERAPSIAKDPILLWSTVRVLLDQGQADAALALTKHTDMGPRARRDVVLVREYVEYLFGDVARLLRQPSQYDGGPRKAADFADERYRVAHSVRRDTEDVLAGNGHSVPRNQLALETTGTGQDDAPPLPWQLLAAAHQARMRQEFEQALRLYDACLEHAPAFAAAHLGRAKVLCKLGRGTEASIAFEKHLAGTQPSGDDGLVATLEYFGPAR